MRVLIGTAVGPSVASSLLDLNASLLLAVLASLASVVVLVLAGTRLFQRHLQLSRGEAFLSALPGGLSFMIALADELKVADQSSRPRIALIHTVRVVAVVLFVSLLAAQLGSDITRPAFFDWFDLPVTTDLQWLMLALLVLIGFVLAERLAIPGAHVTLPLILSSITYATGILAVPMPALIITLAMMVLGTILGCQLGTGPRREYPRLAIASILFTVCAFIIGAGLAALLGRFTAFGFLTLFLAFVPGGIAEVALIALSLGLDVGLIALVHLGRFVFIMLVGPLGLKHIARDE